MKKLYSYKEINQMIKGVLVALIIIFCLGSNDAYAEGTKQLATKAGDRVYLALNDAKHGNFGNYDSKDIERLYIHIKDPANELIYFGFSQFVNSGHTQPNSSGNNINTWMRIKDPNGVVVWPHVGSHNGEKVPENMITSLEQVKNGPNQICGSGGYDAFVFYPSSGAGDYYIEFSAAQATNKKRPIYTEWWDITVATDDASPEAIDGRVYAKQWALVSPRISTYSYDRDFNGKVYSYAESTSYTGGYVTEVDFENSGFRGARFNLAFNSKGTDNAPDFEVNRRSVEDENKLSPEFKIFLNEPDEAVYPSAEGFGQFITGAGSEYPSLFGCEGEYFFRVAVTKKGRIDLLLDFHGSNNKYDPNTRDRIITTLSNPFPNEEGILIRDVQWDGLDGLGAPVADVELNSVSCVFDYFLGTFHFPMYDVEHLTQGIVPRTVRPTTPTSYTPKLYWDDSNIQESLPGGQLKVDLTGEKAPSHYWIEYDYGNENTINTYWHSYSSGVVTTVALEQTRDCALFEPGTISGTVFNDLNRDGVMDAGELPLLGAEVRLYWDKDYDKSIGGNDELVKTFITKAPGSFGYPEGLGNYIFSPEIGKEYLVEVSNNPNVITGVNPRSYTVYSPGVEHFDQNFGVAPFSKVSLFVSENTIQENNETSSIIVDLDYSTLLPATISLAYGGTAETSDYSLTPGLNAINSTTIVIPVGESRGEIVLTSTYDLFDEENETISVDIVSSENAIENGVQSKVITIIDGNIPICDLIDNDPLDNSISENAEADDLVHITALATDVDGDAITYHLINDAGGRFKIDLSSGVVTVANESLIDFELDEFHTIEIESRSSDGSKVSKEFTILITDVDATGGDTDHAITNLIDNDPAANSISENVLADALVHITALATDEDGDNITYELVNNAGNRFKIDANTGVVTVADAGLIDFETDESHIIKIKATSSDNSTVEENFTIVVTDVDATGGDTDHAITNLIDNDPAANSISENVLEDALVHITALATDEDGDNITYELVNNAGNRFKIDANTGVVTVADAGLIDFETDESHIIKIKATSSDNSTIEENFTVVVTDVDATGGDTDHAITNLIDNDPAANSISENVLTDALVHITALATDEDGDNITYFLLDDAGGRFKIDANNGVVTVADASLIDFEIDVFHIIEIEARSTDGTKVSEGFAILITDVDATGGDTDHAITNLIDNDPAANSISENVLVDALVHITALATDEDGDNISYELVDDASGRFKIDANTGVVTVADASLIDFEIDESHIIKIKATSSDNSTIEENFTIVVTDVDATGGDTDHAITNLIDNDPAANSISENVLVDALVHITALATDEDGDNITYELVDDALGRFKIDANTGVVTVADASLIDFEIDESHIFKIKATSSDNSTIEENFTIVVTDVDATGGDTDHAITNLIDNDPAANSISENVLVDALVHITALATDEDGDNITYVLVDDASGRFKIDANTGVVTVADASQIDFETDESHIIKIKATSSDNSTIEENFTIVVTDVDATGGDTDHAITNLIDNDPAANSISENVLVDAPVHITALATDEDGDNITYELVDDASGRFKIDANTGVVTVADASLIDFETDESHIIKIKATSSDDSTVEENFTIVVTDVDATGGDTDHAITNLIDNDPAANSISENVLVDALVHITALATDEDGDNITYELVDDASGRFKIDANTGVVTVADASQIDFETDESHIIKIKATSSDNSTIEENFTIVVTDVDATGGDTDHAITNLIDNDPAANTISENVLADALVHITALATDEDGDNISYELVDDASGRFKIDANTGVVTVADASQIDFEMDESHIIKIKATSSDNSTIEENFTIVVTDVDATGGDTDHAITNLIDNDPAANSISENVLVDALVHITALATDEDGDNISYELVDDASGRFKIDANTGVVTVADASLIDFEMDESHIIKIKATSSDNSTIEENFTIVVTDVDATGGDTDHAITNLIDNDPAANSISENVLVDAHVHITALATDEDGDNISYELVDDASGRFKIDANTGVVTVADASQIDFETDESHIIKIKATSSDNSTVEENFTIFITDADGDTDHPISDLIDNEERENIISENVLNDAPVHITAHATDLDDDAITYHLIDDDNGRFKIQELSGVVTVKDESQIDFESNASHSIRIEARSADGSKISGDFPIFVTDVDGSGGDTDHAITNLIDNDPVDNIISEIEANDSPVHITALATDEDGDIISYHLLDDAGGRFKIDMTTGVVTIANESLIDFEMDESHMIRIEARSTDESVIADNFTISITDIDEILQAKDDIAQVNEDAVLNGDNLLTNDYKAPGTSLTINTNPVADVKNGELIIHTDGTYTYTPNLNYNGSDSFVYAVCDDGSPQQCDQATVNITVQSINDGPLAMNDEAQVNEDEILNGASVLDNDSDLDSDDFEINTSPIEDVGYGILTINSNGTYTYIPDADFNGTDRFIYEICDNESSAACGQATVTITVLPVNDAPRVFDFEMEVKEASLNNPINLESPYDPDGDELSVKILTTVDFGEIVLSNGRILNDNDNISVDDLLSMEFNARERYIGELTMLYEVSDESGLSTQGRVKIIVIPIDVFIPNAITPNNDFLNDKFKVVGLERFPENSLEIFNRWGNIVYKKRDYDNSWEGYGNVSGQISQDRLPPGTYYYIFKFGINKKPLSGYVYMTY